MLTIGETMALLDPVEDGPPRSGSTYRLRVGGAETNVAITLSRLGVQVAWISALGTDPLGDLVLDTVAAEQVDVRGVRRVAGAPTGVFLKTREGGESTLHYYRRGSAATHLGVSDLPAERLASARLLHLTGITCALGDSPRGLVIEAIRRAATAGVTTTFDLNYRPTLWSDPDAAEAAYREVLPHAAWCFCSVDEGRAVFGARSAEEVAAAVQAAGAAAAAVRVGRHGVLLATDGRLQRVAPTRIEDVVDDIGAGDAFAAGFIWGLLHDWPADDCASAGNMLAAHALRGTGDWETAPRLADIREELAACHAGVRESGVP